ncbi:hypothetical protein [Solirubrobacter deserti]|uniref:hypothetical protein n=1 Tax=Solirubrobacter deserti TaxID=2282478 RepID=UPI0022CD4466|nr:hypothetical protein [Solirubrobacter deserti]
MITDIVIPLASSGALTAATEVFKAWLNKRPQHRSLDVEYEVEQDGAPSRSGKLSIDAENVDDAVLEAVVANTLNGE